MQVNTDTMVSMTEANQNFSKVARLVDEKGSAIILKNNTPKYLVLDFSRINQDKTLADADVMALSNKLLKENLELYKVLADE
ncbi:type II toxin-antitoxin system Phd/YefM family antitoxin [Acidaminococcus timonensis]|uniref:type II toxin-antitoxin system Phd/YefM family antitoxin n=1 Tax=Acidaminococcus timonensis TaxID=1871002 RepID=UPI0015B61A48|nr:type II toxin-antitoxin system Phd/YefM family antitoxin [Acidaminococcus timonensis]